MGESQTDAAVAHDAATMSPIDHVRPGEPVWDARRMNELIDERNYLLYQCRRLSAARGTWQ